MGDSNGEIPDAECLLKFVLPETYPDALPEIEVVDPEESNLDETDVKGLLDKLKEVGGRMDNVSDCHLDDHEETIWMFA